MARIPKIVLVAIGLLVAGHVAAGDVDTYSKTYGFKVEVTDAASSGPPSTDTKWKSVKGVFRQKSEIVEHRMTLRGTIGGCVSGTTRRAFTNNFTVEVDGWSKESTARATKLSLEPVDFDAATGRQVGAAVATLVFNRGSDQGQEIDRWGRNPVAKNVNVSLKSQTGEVVRTWTLKSCKPLEWSSIDLNAQGGAQFVRDSIKVSCASLTTVSSCNGAGDRARNTLIGVVGTRRKLGRIAVSTLNMDGTVQQSLRLEAPAMVSYTPPSFDAESETEAEETMELVGN